jgi:hypothetical protein
MTLQTPRWRRLLPVPAAVTIGPAASAGHFGRQKSSVASTRRVGAFRYADCTIIADPSSTLAHRTRSIDGRAI